MSRKQIRSSCRMKMVFWADQLQVNGKAGRTVSLKTNQWTANILKKKDRELMLGKHRGDCMKDEKKRKGIFHVSSSTLVKFVVSDWFGAFPPIIVTYASLKATLLIKPKTFSRRKKKNQHCCKTDFEGHNRNPQRLSLPTPINKYISEYLLELQLGTGWCKNL